MLLAPLLAAGALHTPAKCAVAWNHRATAQQRAVVTRAHPRGAFVDAHTVVGVDSVTKSGGTTSTSGPGCSIAFILRTGLTLNFWGNWFGSTILGWHGPISSGRVFIVPNNARVHADGTIGFHG